MNTPSSGGVVAEGFRQITQQYRGRKYIGNRINLWVIAPYFNFPSEDLVFKSQSFTREFFSYFGIGYLDFERWGLFLDFEYSNPDMKIFVKNLSSYDKDDHMYGDINIISDSVAKKMDRL